MTETPLGSVLSGAAALLATDPAPVALDLSPGQTYRCGEMLLTVINHMPDEDGLILVQNQLGDEMRVFPGPGEGWVLVADPRDDPTPFGLQLPTPQAGQLLQQLMLFAQHHPKLKYTLAAEVAHMAQHAGASTSATVGQINRRLDYLRGLQQKNQPELERLLVVANNLILLVCASIAEQAHPAAPAIQVASVVPPGGVKA